MYFDLVFIIIISQQYIKKKIIYSEKTKKEKGKKSGFLVTDINITKPVLQ